MGSSISAMTRAGESETGLNTNEATETEFAKEVGKTFREDPGALDIFFALTAQQHSEARVEESYQKEQQLKRDIVELEGKYIALREELEVQDKDTEDIDKPFIKQMIACDKHALAINERYVKDKLRTIQLLEDILEDEDPQTDDVDIQNAFALQKQLREKEGDIRKRLHVPFPVALFPELDKDTPFMVSLIRGVPEEHQERYLLTVLRWSRAARRHREVE